MDSMETAVWSSQTISTPKLDDCGSSQEREARSVALERTYVHDVYQQIASHFSDPRHPHRVWPRVKQFLLDLEPGSVVCDVGCGNGKYLDVNPCIYKIGLDRCVNLTSVAREKEHEVLVCDNLSLPFRDECFDAVLSVAVIHHFATMERRVEALKELSRVLRIGGKLMVTVWAMEQRHRKFDSQDVLVPWNKPTLSSSDDKTSSIERDLNSTTTTTSDDDITHYHAYTQTSDSDSFPSLSRECRRRAGKVRHRGRSIDPHYPSSSHSSSDLSSPNESCYSFVRRALQKLAGTKRNRGGRTPWFLQGLEGQDELNEPFASGNEDNVDDFMPIELRQLESTEFAELLHLQEATHNRLLFTNALSPRRRRTLETTCGLQQTATTIEVQPKSKSLSDLLSLIPMSFFRGGRNPIEHFRRTQQSSGSSSNTHKPSIVIEPRLRRRSSLSEAPLSPDPDPDPSVQFPDFVRHKAVQTESYESLEISVNGGSLGGSTETKITIKVDTESNTFEFAGVGESLGGPEHSGFDGEPSRHRGAGPGPGFGSSSGSRPVLVKQKHTTSVGSTCHQQNGSPETREAGAIGNVEDASENRKSFISIGSDESGGGGAIDGGAAPQRQSSEHLPDDTNWKDIQQSVKNLPEFKSTNTLRPPEPCVSVPSSARAAYGLSSIWKQSSLNEDLIFTERLKEKEKLKQHIQKQCSLNEELIYTRRENTRWDQMKEAFFNHTNVKRIQLLTNNLSNRFRGTEPPETGASSSYSAGGVSSGGYEQLGSSSSLSTTTTMKQAIQGSSLRNGFVRMLKNWKTTDEQSQKGDGDSNSSDGSGSSSPSMLLGSRRGSKEGVQRRGLFPPFFLRRSSVGSLNVGGKNGTDGSISMSPLTSPPYLLKRRPSENDLGHENGSNGTGKLLPGARHVRKLSREEGSDSSKDSSFQSDTSVDSEDSFASVIFIPRPNSVENSGPGGANGNDNCFFNSDTRANSTDSDRSPKSPASKLSPPNYNTPKSPSPLASELYGRKKSPDVSPTRFNLPTAATSTDAVQGPPTKFVFDEPSTQPYQVYEPPPPQSTEEPPRAPPVTASGTADIGGASAAVAATLLKKESKRQGGEKAERIVVLRKPAVNSESKTVLTRQQVRRSLPKELALELFNPEVDDVDTSDTSSSSPNSVSSVVSVLNEESVPPPPQTATATAVTATESEIGSVSHDVTREVTVTSSTAQVQDKAIQLSYQPAIMTDGDKLTAAVTSLHFEHSTKLPVLIESDNEKNEDESQPQPASCIEEQGGPPRSSASKISSSSFDNLTSSPKTRRKTAMSRFGNTSEWLYSLPSDLLTSDSGHHHKRAVPERRTSGEKMLFGEQVKKFQQKGPDAKWPASITDESPSTKSEASEEVQRSDGTSCDTASHSSSDSGPVSSNKKSASEEFEEKESLFDSIENLANKQQPSRNPSLDSSLRMSSTCSCSIRGGDSFDSWTSAKSSLTNSSHHSAHHKSSYPSLITLPLHPGNGNKGSGGRHDEGAGGCFGCGCGCGCSSESLSLGHERGKSKRLDPSKTWSTGTEDTEDSSLLTYHRYYHVFQEGELDKLIEKYVQNLHVISSYYDHANWCIIAEKVQVWTI